MLRENNMNTSNSTLFSIFIALVLVFGVFSVKETVYGQTNATSSAGGRDDNKRYRNLVTRL
jgi:hypothetical protein